MPASSAALNNSASCLSFFMDGYLPSKAPVSPIEYGPNCTRSDVQGSDHWSIHVENRLQIARIDSPIHPHVKGIRVSAKNPLPKRSRHLPEAHLQEQNQCPRLTPRKTDGKTCGMSR